jgi:hypothetical protein
LRAAAAATNDPFICAASLTPFCAVCPARPIPPTDVVRVLQ